MDTQLLMNTAMLAGEVMLRSGAETYRVEDTVRHILNTAEKLEIAEILVLLTGFTVTLKVAGEEAITVVKRVGGRGTHLGRVVKVNAISRAYCSGELTLKEAYKELENLKNKEFSRRSYNLALIGTCAGFALFFSGEIWDMMAAVGVGVVLALFDSIGKRLTFNALLQDIFDSVGIAAASIFLKLLLGGRMNMDVVVIGSIMPLVPGMAITNAVRDTLKGDYLSGAARILEAFLTAAGIAIGIALGILLFGGMLRGGLAS